MTRKNSVMANPTTKSQSFRTVPYGVANFYDIRRKNKLYVDKTRFIRELEAFEYVFLIRPRRFGKSCWVSVLENYYDCNQADQFDFFFGGLDIGNDPTEEHNQYVVVRFDFSAVNDALDTLESSFERYVDRVLALTCKRYPDLFPEAVQQSILTAPQITDKLDELFNHTLLQQIPLYILIDEYDNFANTILSHHGQSAYHQFTHGEGFYRNFFSTLKAGTTAGSGGIKRLFITGVSPITMDDVTSGFNIGKNVSRMPQFNEMLGLTEEEVQAILQEYQTAEVFNQDVEKTMDLMRNWYNGYRFSESATTVLYNTDMVLHYLSESVPNYPGPLELIDSNIRIDYEKLKHLMWINQQLNGNFDRLKTIIEDGSIGSQLVSSFPLKEITRPQNFISLLHYFGLLTIERSQLSQIQFKIPNRTIAELMYGYLRSTYSEADIFRIDVDRFANLINQMALKADWKPAFTFLAEAIERQTSVRDYLEGEKVIQGFLLAYLNVTNVFLCRTEQEYAKGFADLVLQPFRGRYPQLQTGYLIELKYIKRQKSLKATVVQNAIEEAQSQLQQYLQEASLQHDSSVQYVGLILVFHGWEMVACEPYSGDGLA